jgi:hypothetical protein
MMPAIQTFNVFTHPSFYLCLILVALLSVKDFRTLSTGQDVRLFVTRRRYILGAGLYVLCALFSYGLLVPLFAQFIQVWLLAPQSSKLLGQAISLAGISFLLLFILAPKLPLLATFVSKLQAYAQSVALFPGATDNLLVLMDRSEFKPSDAAWQSVANELAQYGVVRKDDEIDKHLMGNLSAVAEIEEIRMQVQLREPHGSNNDSITLDRAYSARFAELDLQRSHMFGRLAQALLVNSALNQLMIASTVPEKTQRASARAANALSCLTEDIAGELLLIYRRAIASFSVSQISSPKRRSEFLQHIGYTVPDRLALPFWPIVASFAVVLLGMAIPPIILGQRALIQQVGPVAFYAIFANQAIIHSICIWLAIWPKYHFNSSRPSLTRLPLTSYLGLAGAAYLTSVVLTKFLLLAFPRLPFAAHAPLSYLIQSIMPTCYSLLVAVRIDRHLLQTSSVRWKDRLIDAGIFIASIATAQLIVANLFRYLVPGIPQSSYLSSLLPNQFSGFISLIDMSEYTLIFAVIAGVIGFTVPVTSSEAIMQSSPARRRTLDQADPVEPSLSHATINVRPKT